MNCHTCRHKREAPLLQPEEGPDVTIYYCNAANPHHAIDPSVERNCSSFEDIGQRDEIQETRIKIMPHGGGVAVRVYTDSKNVGEIVGDNITIEHMYGRQRAFVELGNRIVGDLWPDKIEDYR